VTTASVAPVLSLTDRALCLGCNYPLRGLPATRCPECGREFDPEDPWTIWIGRAAPQLIRRLTQPMARWLRRLVTMSCLGILWGAAWLPAGAVAESLGWIVVIDVSAFIIFRRMLRFLFRRSVTRLGLPPSERDTRGQKLVVFLAMTSTIGWWPLRVSLFVQRPLLDRFAWHAYAELPMDSPPRTPRFVGLLLVMNVHTVPNCVTINTPRGRLICDPDGGWPYELSRSDEEYPWWLQWLLPPISGKWAVVPDSTMNLFRLWNSLR
jgi:hypothetical protein